MAIAIIAVAVLGLIVLSGRLPRRRAIEVILGCFIIFGASTVATGLLDILGGSADSQDAAIAQRVPLSPVPVAVRPPAPTVPYDPYAGAALPARP